MRERNFSTVHNYTVYVDGVCLEGRTSRSASESDTRIRFPREWWHLQHLIKHITNLFYNLILAMVILNFECYAFLKFETLNCFLLI